LLLGCVAADTNSGGMTRKFKETIEVNANNVVVKGKKFDGTFIKPILAALTERLSSQKIKITEIPTLKERKPPVDHESKNLTQSWLWDELAKFLKPGDVVIGETGTTTFGLLYAKMPKEIRFVTQTYYGSIGHATPAALGADIALQELHRDTGAPRGRTVLVTGDGSMQLTMQEIGTMVTFGFKPIIIIINNAGYTIERVIHGARQPYNDINLARYEYLLPFFGHDDAQASYRKVETKEEFPRKVFEDKKLCEPSSVQVLELVLDRFDVPWRLTKVLSLRGPKYIEELKEAGFIGEGRVGIGG